MITPNQTVVHRLKAGAFSLEAGKRHELPLLDEEVATVFAHLTDVLELLSHELALHVADALRKGTLNVDCESFRTLNSRFHCTGRCWIVSQVFFILLSLLDD